MIHAERAIPQDAAAPGRRAAVSAAWRALAQLKIGILPAPLVVVVLGVCAAFVALGDAPSDLLMNIAVLAVGGFLCAEAGRRIPGLRRLGLGAILATFAPSFLVYAKA